MVSNLAGRVVGPDGAVVPRVYVTGWIKRGSRGVIGTNRACAAAETLGQLLADFDEGKLAGDVVAPERSAPCSSGVV